jgi:uncharacterized protein DUF3224
MADRPDGRNRGARGGSRAHARGPLALASGGVRAEATFEVVSFTPTDVEPEPAITTGLPVGVARMEKRLTGEAEGRTATLFTAAFDQAAGVGTYVAMESFQGSLNGHPGAFNFVHSAATAGEDRTAEHFAIVPSSGTAELSGIRGTGGLAIDADGTHRIWFEYELD